MFRTVRFRPILSGLLIFTLLNGLLAACSEGATTPTPAPAGVSPAATTTIATPGATTASATTAASTVTATTPSGDVLGPANGVTPGSSRGDIPDISPYGDYKPFEQRWKVNLSEPSNVGIVGETDGMTFAKSRLGGLYAFSTTSGALAWKIPDPVVTDTVSPQPPLALVAPGLVLLGDVQADKVTAYDAKSGQKRWDFDLTFDAPNRDKGSRFIGGKVYNKVLVVGVSSKQDPYAQQNPAAHPEYLLIEGINLDSGKEVWSALTDAAPANRLSRLGDIVFTSKLVVVEAPDLTVGGIEAETGKRMWRVADLFLLRNEDNPDALFSLVPDPGKLHSPVIALSDLQTGKLVWQKALPINSIEDPLVVISPDQKHAYVSVVASSTQSYLFHIDLDKNEATWKLDTSPYGTYDLRAFNDGVRLRNYGPKSGVAFFGKDDPQPPLWFAGGIQIDDVVTGSEGLYMTARDNKSGLFYLVGTTKGEVRFSTRLEISASVPFVGQELVYVTTLDANNKPIIYAFKRPK